ncbi:MAG: PP2C family protein-serine/threonine phosphatase [Myxococcota bacterium]
MTAAYATNAYPVSLDTAGATHVGRKRQVNEDAYFIATLQRSMVVHDASPAAARGWLAGQPAGTLLIVADGMGGMGGGELASRLAVETVAEYLLNVMPWATRLFTPNAGRESSLSLPDVREQLSSAIVVGDATVKSAGARAGTPRMGTTLTVAFVVWPLLYVAHVGDSRCNLLRGGRLTRLTTDHTLAQQYADQATSPDQIPDAWHNILWNSLGGGDDVPRPQIAKHQLEPNDVLMLCSDGLTKHVSDEEITSVILRESDNAKRCEQLIQRANEAGGTDNITVVMASALTAGA